jgi:hypothetical protein
MRDDISRPTSTIVGTSISRSEDSLRMLLSAAQNVRDMHFDRQVMIFSCVLITISRLLYAMYRVIYKLLNN